MHTDKDSSMTHWFTDGMWSSSYADNWSCIIQIFSRMLPFSSIVVCSTSPSGLRTRPGILYSQLIISGRCHLFLQYGEELCIADMWFPYANAFLMRVTQSISGSGCNSMDAPTSRELHICCQNGWPSTISCNRLTGLNTNPGWRGE